MNTKRTVRYWPLIPGLLVGIAGYLGPWVPHKAAGLVVTGLDLAEYVKFLPQFRSGEIGLQREIFYLPLAAASLSCALLAGRRTLPAWARLGSALAAIPLSLTMLPPAWRPTTLNEPEFAIQIVAILACLLAVPGVVLTRFLTDRLVLVLTAFLSAAAGVIPFWGFLVIRPAVEALYRQPLPIGWGAWACLCGGLVTAFTVVVEVTRKR